MTADELAKEVASLPLADRLSLLNSLSENAELGPQERAFLNEYVATMDPGLAAKRAGYPAPNNSGWRLLNTHNEVKAAAVARVTAAEEESGLTASYVREYIKDSLELCPTDYFLLGSDGEWMVDPVQFRELPDKVKRLVNGVETRIVGGRMYFTVEFLDKRVSLALAARYTLAKAEQRSSNDEFFRALMDSDEADGNAAIERRIAEARQGAETRSSAPRIVSVAAVDAVQQTA